jgi:DNA-binding NarL/FixJ family response regulator
LPELTDREREVLGLLAAGLPNGAIARRLVLGPKTVRAELITKLHVSDRAEAMARARAAGLGLEH